MKKNIRYSILYICLGIICLVLLHTIFRSKIEGFTDYELPKLIWGYWDDPKLPKLIEQIQTHNNKVLKGWDIRFYNRDTIKDVIDPREYPKDFDNYKPTQQSDWFRLYLLKHHGGCWMDASIIVNSEDALNDLYYKSMAKKSELTAFSFYSSDANTFTTKGGDTFPLYIESWFLIAPKGSKLIHDWYSELNTAFDISFVEYRKKLLEGGFKFLNIYTDDPNNTYYTVFAGLQKLLQSMERIPPMIIHRSEDTAYKILTDCNGDARCTMNKIKDSPKEANKHPYIKLHNGNRSTNIDISNYFESMRYT
jgi:hypothetical protein